MLFCAFEHVTKWDLLLQQIYREVIGEALWVSKEGRVEPLEPLKYPYQTPSLKIPHYIIPK